MKDHLDFISRFGVGFANTVSSKLLTEANSKTATGQAYSLPDALRQEMVARVAVWKEAIIVFEHLKTVLPPEALPLGFREIPKASDGK